MPVRRRPRVRHAGYLADPHGDRNGAAEPPAPCLPERREHSPLPGPAAVASASLSGPEAVLFPLFLLLAGLVAALIASSPGDPERAAAAMASLHDRFGPDTRPITAGSALVAALASLERFRRKEARGEEPDPVPPTLLGSWNVALPPAELFPAAATAVQPEARPFLYRLAQMADQAAPEGVILTVTIPAATPDDTALAATRLEDIARRLISLGAPPVAVRVQMPQAPPDAIRFQLAPLSLALAG